MKVYIKGITKNSDGTWTAHYEGRRVYLTGSLYGSPLLF
ncbi:LCI fold-containing protein [Bacillus sp. SL00103]